MFAKIRKIKNLLKVQNRTCKVEDFKMFIRTNKNNNYQKNA
jgi:DNA repair helicase Rad3